MPRPKKSSYGNEKPPLSYVALCAMAIRSSSAGMMSLNEIYRYIVDTFPYYKNTCSKWRNSLRHNLSFNDCFVKIIHGSENGNKRSLWSLHPNCGDMFEDGSLLRRKRRFTTNKKRQKEDGISFGIRQSSKVDESELVASVGQKREFRDTIANPRGFIKITNPTQKKNYGTGQGDLSFVNKKRKEGLTNFTIENILNGSFSSQKKDFQATQTYIEKNSAFVQRKHQYDSNQNFEGILHSCTCNSAQQIESPYKRCIELPIQALSYQDYHSCSQYARHFCCKQGIRRPSRESFTLHYKARWL